MSKNKMTHVDAKGAARMVDVGAKPLSQRRAVAEGFVRCSRALINCIRQDDLQKGNLLQVARLAGIQAARRTDELIPLCHVLPLDGVHRMLLPWRRSTTPQSLDLFGCG